MYDIEESIEQLKIDNSEMDWSKEWAIRYKQFVTTLPEKDNLDLLLFTLPSHDVADSPNWPDGEIKASPKIMSDVTTAVAQIATSADEHGINAGICYTHTFRAVGKDRESEGKRINYGFMNPHDAAMTALSSGTKTVGLSLQSSLDLIYASKMIEEMKELSVKTGRVMPRIIVGGPQASLDKEGTMNRLGLEDADVIPGRGELKILKALGVDDSKDNIEGSTGFNPLFMKLPDDGHLTAAVNLSFISTGGEACIGKAPCAFCNAYHLGRRVDKPEDETIKQITSLAGIGVSHVRTADNFINLALPNEAKRYIHILQEAKKKGVRVPTFLSRPDLIASTDDKTLEEVRKFSNETFMGIESGDIRTLIAMDRITGGEKQAEAYIERTRVACKKLGNQNFDMILSGIVAYPIESTIEEARRADRQTVMHFRELMKIAKGKDNSVRVNLDPVWMLSGSKITKEMIKRGASPEALEEYNLETRDEWWTLVNSLPDGDWGIGEVVLNGDEESINKVLDYLENRRRKLDSLVGDKFIKP